MKETTKKIAVQLACAAAAKNSELAVAHHEAALLLAADMEAKLDEERKLIATLCAIMRDTFDPRCVACEKPADVVHTIDGTVWRIPTCYQCKEHEIVRKLLARLGGGGKL